MSTPPTSLREIDALVSGVQDPLQDAESVPVSTDYFRVGTPVQLTVSLKQQMLSGYSVILGYRSGRFLLVELPSVEGRALVVSPSAPVRVRYLLEGRLLGFSSETLKVQFTPEKLVFLNYPNRVDQLALRRHERVRVSLPTLVRVGDDPRQLPAETRDLSVSGCGVSLGHSAPQLKKGERLTVYFKPPGDESLFKARVWARVVKKHVDGTWWVGCEFDFRPGEEDTKLMVERMVLARTGRLSTSDLDPSVTVFA